jgi:hypothetical protein
MANNLTGLIKPIYASLDMLSREMVGMIPSVSISGKAEMAALNQEITYSITEDDADPYDIVPAAQPPALLDSDYGTGAMKITKVQGKRFYWTGDDEARLDSGVLTELQNNKILANMRKLVNKIEADLAGLYVHASRAYGTAGTTPFVTAGDWTDLARVLQILKDNGAPQTDLRLVLNTSAGANLLGNQSRVDLIGTDNPLLRGIIENRMNFQIRESAQIISHTKGTGTGYLVNNASGIAVAATDVAIDTGSGTVLAGDIVNFADAGTWNYVVGTGVAAAGTIAINKPGVRQAIVDGKAMTIGNSYAANMAFSQSAIHLLSRLPLLPTSGDVAVDEMMVADPVSGIQFRVAMYKGYHANQIEISTAWGVKAVKPEHITLLLG